MVNINMVLVPEEESTIPFCRIVHLERDSSGEHVAWIFRLEGKGCPPERFSLSLITREIQASLVHVKTWVPPTALYSESELTPFQIRSRDRASAILNALKDRAKTTNLAPLLHKSSRGPLVAFVASDQAIDPKTVYEAMYRYWRNGMTEAALIPAIGTKTLGRGAKEGEKRRGPKIAGASPFALSDKVRKTMDAAILRSARAGGSREYIYNQVKIALCEKTVDAAGRSVLLPPDPAHDISLEQFRYAFNKLNKSGQLDRKLAGAAKFDLEHSSSLHAAHEQHAGPAAEYQMDDSGTQIEVVNVAGEPIGAAFIILVIDTWSNMICGFHLDLGTASEESYALAFYNSIIDKVAFCAFYGIKIDPSEWPVSGTPVRYLSDNGSAYRSNRTSSYVISLPINLSNAKARAGYAKGDVENIIGVIKSRLFRYIAGHRPKSGKMRGTGNPKKRAVYTIYELRVLVIRWILSELQRPMPRRAVPVIAQMNKVRATPLDLWNWGCENLTAPLQALPEEQLWVHLLPEVEARITREGISYRKFHYTCDEYVRDRRFQFAKDKTELVKARSDPSRPDLLYVQDKRAGKFITCRRIDLSSDMHQWTYADSESMDESANAERRKVRKEQELKRAQLIHDLDEANRTARRRAKDRGSVPQSAQSVAEKREEEQGRLRESDIEAARSGMGSVDAPDEGTQDLAQKPGRKSQANLLSSYIEDEISSILREIKA
ncbi:Mu transposase C-terminal domain-containing protein [Solimonas sp. SE-A11]|uniref:Mu transposase C-terminal domain-containing protein n=1 Tax=Solimonas sp. SE-A11 TaxID=3054954 RepID=UPI00259CA6A8|nr:Mu transposase C-terminal domain-containing protein [Solimonas sp. SE-A11]MDM4772859.1 Mu transposase C-terminal domain-containing protein [Solimonas sp. SE-A11]